MKSEQINELAAALAKAQGAMSAASLDGNNPHFKSRYATLASIIEAARQPLSQNGLSVSQLLNEGETGVTLETWLMHESGQWMQSEINVTAGTNKGVNVLQSFGSALTYYKRYALAAIIGISAADDDDGNNAAPQEQSTAQPRPRISIVPSKPDDLLTLINKHVQVPYDNIHHLKGGIAKHLDNHDWNWPKGNDIDGWRAAYKAAKDYADSKTTEAAPDLDDVFGAKEE